MSLLFALRRNAYYLLLSIINLLLVILCLNVLKPIPKMLSNVLNQFYIYFSFKIKIIKRKENNQWEKQRNKNQNNSSIKYQKGLFFVREHINEIHNKLK